MNLTNKKNIGLSMAVFLAHDDYDYDPRPNVLSATTLQKSARQIILSKRIIASDATLDISSMIASTFGTAIHDAVEKAWANNSYKKAMRKLGYSQDTVDRFKVNPKPEELTANDIPIYMEQRAECQLGNWIIVGKFDFVGDGQLEDHKTTGVYAYMNKTNTEKYRQQGSVYRWLNPTIITNDKMIINFVFTDWSSLKAEIEKAKGYPSDRLLHMHIELMSMTETQKWIADKIKEIEVNLDVAEPDLPLCNKSELWQNDTVYAYYKNPDKTDKSTKNYDNFAEAQMHFMKDGSVGAIKIRRGMVKFCAWCPAAPICSQCAQLIADGLFIPEGEQP